MFFLKYPLQYKFSKSNKKIYKKIIKLKKIIKDNKYLIFLCYILINI